MKYMLRFTSGFLVLVLLLAVPFRTVSAADAMPTTETEGIVDGGLYRIRNAAVDSKCLDYDVLHKKVRLTLSNPNDTSSYKNQNFNFRASYLGDGTYALIPMTWRTNRLQANGDRLTVAPPNDSPEQRWYIIPCEGGYEIRSAAGNHPLIGASQYLVPILSSDTPNCVWSLEPMPEMEETGNYIYVHAPAHWRPALGNTIDSIEESVTWCSAVMMDQEEGGWYSFPSPNCNTLSIYNYNICPPDDQITRPDIFTHAKIEPGKDYWIVVHDDPNVDGDLSVSVYYSKPENLPETADPAALAPAAAALIVSTLALLVSVKMKPKEL